MADFVGTSLDTVRLANDNKCENQGTKTLKWVDFQPQDKPVPLILIYINEGFYSDNIFFYH